MEIDEQTREKFFKRVVKTDDCWLWGGDIDKDGYGRFRFHERRIPSHRISWLITGQVIPEDKPIVRHKCRSRSCVNPDHLEVGTQIENMADKIRDGTHICGERCPSAKLTNEEVLEIRRRSAKGEKDSNLAEAFEVSRRTISFIIKGLSWKHL
jgi:hypothetical protein